MTMKIALVLWACCLLRLGESFLIPQRPWRSTTSVVLSSTTATTPEEEAVKSKIDSSSKQKLLDLLGTISSVGVEDPILIDPFTKESIRVSSPGPVLGDNQLGGNIRYLLKSSNNTFEGNSNGFWNLLEPIPERTTSYQTYRGTTTTTRRLNRPQPVLRNVIPFIPPPLRSALATAGFDMGDDYVPMRDLFTSPAVSFAYERGWRQGFAAAGFPGADREAELAMAYFEPAFVLKQDNATGTAKTLVDMSCATGLFTRRFAKTKRYERVIGCDYSASMLNEARRRIQADPEFQRESFRNVTRVDLVQCDVGQIPMKSNSINALHAGAAMHCWPDLPAAVSEIYRVLKPGGRYFATTFLSSYFGNLQNAEGGATGPSRQAFQYFESVYQLRKLLEAGGFAKNKISIEVLGRACVVIRCQK